MKTLYIASDHAGFRLKSFLCDRLAQAGHTVHDLGPAEAISCNYPDGAKAVTEKILTDSGSLGILICGTGLGMCMAANRVHGIRAALASCEFHARMARAHNNANILCLGERVTGEGVAMDITEVFLTTEFEGGRHQTRIDIFD